MTPSAPRPSAPRNSPLPGHILVASKLRLYAEALSEAIRARGGKLVVPVEPEKVIDAAEAGSPDVILVDARDPYLFALVPQLAAAHTGTPVVAVGVDAAEEAITACADAGVSGLILNGHSIDDLVQALRDLVAGNLLRSPAITAVLLRHVRKHRVFAENGLTALTPRELEVLERVAIGRQNKQIARDLGLSEWTVKNHVHNLLEKLGLHNRVAAAALLRRHRPELDRKD